MVAEYNCDFFGMIDSDHNSTALLLFFNQTNKQKKEAKQSMLIHCD